MTLGELLRTYLRDPHTQKSVAMSWLERAQGPGQSWRPAMVESHLRTPVRGTMTTISQHQSMHVGSSVPRR